MAIGLNNSRAHDFLNQECDGEHTMKIHLRGFGVIGSLLAPFLDRAGIDWTWYDKEAAHTAWKASTSAIYPARSYKFGPDFECLEAWRELSSLGFYSDHIEKATFWYCTKNHPHEGKWPTVFALADGLHLSPQHSMHLNAQGLVKDAWAKYSHKRRDTDGEGMLDTIILTTHGFSQRMFRGYWGWTRLVQLEGHPGLFKNATGLRPAFYFRPNRVQMYYCYPQANTGLWYAGSSIMAQKPEGFKSLEIDKKYETWEKYFTALGKGRIKVVDRGETIEGWRPAPKENDGVLTQSFIHRDMTHLVMRPMWNSGIRHWPMSLINVANKIESLTGANFALEEVFTKQILTSVEIGTARSMQMWSKPA